MKVIGVKDETSLKIAICDDEKIYCDRLQTLLEKYASDIEIQNFEIKTFASGALFLDNYGARFYDVIFLDVDMPQLSGFETAERIRQLDTDVEIVFATHIESQIHMGYRYGAKDYLCKPIDYSRLVDVMERALQERRSKQEAGSYKVELKFGGVTALTLADVLYFESHEHYIHAIMQDERQTFRGQLQNVESDLKDRGFVRTHQSYLVNCAHVFKDFNDHVILKTGEKISLSRKYKKEAREAFSGAWT